ncbi:DUF1735 domain-containing protein [Chitinophaga lutea]
MTIRHTMLAAAVLLFSACEKGTDLVTVDSKVYIPQSGLTTQTALLGTSVYELGVFKSGIPDHGGDVKVTVEAAPDALAELLKTNPGYELLPETYYTAPSADLTIPKGQVRADFKISLKGVDESFTAKKYVLPVRIKSVSGADLNETKSVAYLNFQRYRNVYETKYRAYGTSKAAAGTGAVSKVEGDFTSVTASAKSIVIKGLVASKDLLVTIDGNTVTLAGAPGAEALKIAQTAGTTNTYTGEFDETVQANRGKLKLFYTYLNGTTLTNVEIELSYFQ